MPKSKSRVLPSGSTCEVLDLVPAHRLTGINVYLPKEKVVDEWQRVLDLRKEKDLVLGGNRKEPTDNRFILTKGGYGKQLKKPIKD